MLASTTEEPLTGGGETTGGVNVLKLVVVALDAEANTMKTLIPISEKMVRDLQKVVVRITEVVIVVSDNVEAGMPAGRGPDTVVLSSR